MKPSAEHARILVVDEDPAFQLGLKTFLREYVGFEKVYTVQSGDEAIEKILEDDTIDVVTLDYQMPGMTGIEVLEKLRYMLKRPVSFLMITGYPSEELEETFHNCSSPVLLTTHFLSKPIEFEKLEPIVLQAHEEVCAAREVGLAKPPAEKPSEPTPSDEMSELKDRLTEQGAKLDEIERQVVGLRKSWRGDFLKLVLVGGLIFAGVQLGWFEKLKPLGKEMVEKAKVILVGKPDTLPGTEESESTNNAPESDGTETPTNPDPLNEGRPL